MRSDLSSPQCRRFARSSCRVFLQDISDAVTGQLLTAGVAEDEITGASIPDRRQSAKTVHCFTPQRTEALFTSFAMQANLPRTSQAQVFIAHRERFADARTSVI
jgi:hypothetical protein